MKLLSFVEANYLTNKEIDIQLYCALSFTADAFSTQRICMEFREEEIQAHTTIASRRIEILQICTRLNTVK